MISLLERLFERRVHSIFTFILLFLYIFNYRVEHVHNWLNTYKIRDKHEYFNINNLEEPSAFFKSNKSSDQACVIPQLQPYTKSVNETLRKSPTFQSCEKSYPLLFNSTLDGKIVPVKTLQQFFKSGIKSCCYRVIERGRENLKPIDNYYSVSQECFPLSLQHSTSVPAEREFIAIACKKGKPPIQVNVNGTIKLKVKKKANEALKEKYYDMHAFIRHKTKEQLKAFKNLTASADGETRENSEKVNVIVFGLDGVSRMNFIRTMPKSYAYLTETLNAVDMRGYNKVEDNTFPNLMPMLTSLTAAKIASTCGRDKTYDACPFIWKLFQKHGYATSFAEDESHISIFNFERKGFIHLPTDYYLKPFSVAAGELVWGQKLIHTKLCYGPRLTLQVLLDNMKKFVFQMEKQQQPYFQFTWATSLTHDYLRSSELGDVHLLNALEWMNNEGHLENTVLILMSDHGHRVDQFRNTFQGQLEDRLPFMIFKLPDWIKEKYSRAYQNMKGNVDRLVTTFDLHMTLRDILYNRKSLEDNTIEKKEIKLLQKFKNSSKLPTGISLFLPVHRNRTCDMAAIKPNFCSCNYLKPTSAEDKTVKEAASSVVSVINSIIKPFSNCSSLSLDIVKLAQLAGVSDRDWRGYLLNFQTKPGGAMFEALVSKTKGTDEKWSVAGTISRTNLYGNQSHCVHDSFIKLYCFCTDIDVV